jgi:hypothetical protein
MLILIYILLQPMRSCPEDVSGFCSQPFGPMSTFIVLNKSTSLNNSTGFLELENALLLKQQVNANALSGLAAHLRNQWPGSAPNNLISLDALINAGLVKFSNPFLEYSGRRIILVAARRSASDCCNQFKH